MFSWEQWAIGQHVSKDAANRPDVNGFGISLGIEHDLRSSVPTGCNIFCQDSRVVMIWICHSGQPKVTNLKTQKKTVIILNWHGNEVTRAHLVFSSLTWQCI